MFLENIDADCFICEEYDILKDCFTMQVYDDQRRASYSSIAPDTYPDNLIIPVQEGLDLLKMYTQDLKFLSAPKELCLRKAIELLEHSADYELSLSIFKHELTQRFMQECEFSEVDSLVCGIDSLTKYLNSYFTQYGLFIEGRLAYVFERYIEPGMLILTKFMYCNGNYNRKPTAPNYLTASVIEKMS